MEYQKLNPNKQNIFLLTIDEGIYKAFNNLPNELDVILSNGLTEKQEIIISISLEKAFLLYIDNKELLVKYSDLIIENIKEFIDSMRESNLLENIINQQNPQNLSSLIFKNVELFLYDINVNLI